MTRTILLLLSALLAAPVTSWAQTTRLFLDSEPGDYVGGGLEQTFTQVDGTFEARRNPSNGVSIAFHAPDYSHWWYLDFSGPDGAPLEPGVYEGADWYPMPRAGHPGIGIDGDGRGCTASGRFEVLEVTYGSGTNIVGFGATFEQRCDGSAAALRGHIYFNANAPVPPQLHVTLIGCLRCHPGDHLIAQVTLRNPAQTATSVELKAGVRLPDGTGVNLFGPNGQHIVVSLPAGLESTFPILNFTWPVGAPPGVWHVEGALLEPSLGKTLSRDVRIFEIEP